MIAGLSLVGSKLVYSRTCIVSRNNIEVFTLSSLCNKETTIVSTDLLVEQAVEHCAYGDIEPMAC